ncbi:EamA family transporter RarD [Parvibaculum sp.]|jgi:chloramphenicol-sensitive protein RarD|uniref:EamA family transporter RarD n=1 Tax=Parvibaculum sp. TaxID=2024848 RepID=UPI00391884C8
MSTTTLPNDAARAAALGAAAAGGGYLLWGLSVIYYRQLGHVVPMEILAHRALWSLLLVALCIALFRRYAQLIAVLRNRRAMLILSVTSLIIGSNWLVFIWAVNSDRILETSLGYFINPLMSVLAGVMLLGERLSRAQKFAIALAAIAVLYFTFAQGFVPYVSLFLAASFAAYGYLKKVVRAEALEGLFVEVVILAPFGLAWLFWMSAHGGAAFGHAGLYTDILLILTGPMTAVPLILFTYGAQRIRLTTLGLMQYLVPTASFLIAVFLYGEPFGMGQLVTFALIWVALAMFSYDTWVRERELRRLAGLENRG